MKKNALYRFAEIFTEGPWFWPWFWIMLALLVTTNGLLLYQLFWL